MGCVEVYIRAPSAEVRLVRFRVTVAIYVFYLTTLFLWMGSGATWVYTPAFYALHVLVAALAVMVATQQAEGPLPGQGVFYRKAPVRTALYWLIAAAVASYVLSVAHLAVSVLPDLYYCAVGTALSVCTHNYVFTAYIFLVYNPVLLVLLVQSAAFVACP